MGEHRMRIDPQARLTSGVVPAGRERVTLFRLDFPSRLMDGNGNSFKLSRDANELVAFGRRRGWTVIDDTDAPSPRAGTARVVERRAAGMEVSPADGDPGSMPGARHSRREAPCSAGNLPGGRR